MSGNRVYLPGLADGGMILDPDESHHALRVLRLRRGDEVVVFDGQGHEAPAVITAVDRGRALVEFGAVVTRDYDCATRLTLAVAMGKVHRQGYLVEKCTELGVAAIWPLLAERSVARPAESTTARHRRRAIEASKQSGRAWIPEIGPPRRFEEVIERSASFDVAVITDTIGSVLSLAGVLEDAAPSSNILALVGPEGGWSDGERRRAGRADFSWVRLAPTVLRTETAAVAVCAVVAMRSVTGQPRQ